MTQAHLPDGTVLDFPDDTPDSVIDSVVQQHLNPSAPPSFLDNVKNVAGRTARIAALGATSPLNLPYMALNAQRAIGNTMPGPQSPYYKYPTEMVSDLMDKVGLPKANDKLGRIADSAATAIAATPFAGPAGASLNAAASAGLSGAASQGVGEAGYGPVAQTIAGLLGGFTPSGLTIAGKGSQAIGGILKDFVNPASQENIGKILASQADNPIALQQNLSQPVKQFVPGSNPTTAEVGGDTGLIAAQRGFENTNPGLLSPLRQANTAARNQYLDEISGTPADVQRLIENRTETTKPLYATATNNPVNPQVISPIFENIDQALKDVGTHTDAGKAILKLRSDIQNSLGAEKQGPLIQTYKEARDTAAKRADQEGAYSAAVKGVVKPIIHDLGASMETGNPDLLNANSKFREMSQPIKQMQALQDVQERVLKGPYDTHGNQSMRLASFENILSNEGKAELEKILTPEQMERLNNLHSDLKRQSVMNAYRPAGSDTAANNAFSGTLNSLIETKAKSIPLVGDAISNARTNAVQKGLLNAYSSPAVANAALSKALKILQKESLPDAIKRQMISALIGNSAGRVTGLISGVNNGN